MRTFGYAREVFEGDSGPDSVTINLGTLNE
jgi:hypothetical protein